MRRKFNLKSVCKQINFEWIKLELRFTYKENAQN